MATSACGRGPLKPSVEGVEFISLSRGWGDSRAFLIVIWDCLECVPDGCRVIGVPAMLHPSFLFLLGRFAGLHEVLSSQPECIHVTLLNACALHADKISLWE